MRSVRSWFNSALYKKNLTRFWPIWGSYLAIWLFMFPIALILDNYGNPVRFAHRYVLEDIVEVGLPLAVAFALVAAAAVWSYLCNNRSVCLMHTLPVRREGLFLTNFLSGMTFMIGPNLVVFVLTLLAELAVGEVDVFSLVVWLASVSLMEVFFFSFATFCAMFTGHILGLPIFYGILNGLAAGLVALIDLALSRFVFGYSGMEGFYRVAEWLTPVWKLVENLEVRRQQVNGEYLDTTAWLSGFGYILVYVLVGLALAGLALVLYRRRHMERVGDAVTVTWMRPVFQYGVAFCCALAFGSLLYEMFRGALPDGAWTLLAFMLICGAVGYFAARMILEKSFRVFHTWKGCLPFLAVLILLTVVVEMDLTGYERYVPGEAEVKMIQITAVSTRPYDDAEYLALIEETDPEIVRAVLDLHQTVVDEREFIEKNQSGWYYSEETPEGYYIRSRGFSGFNVIYTLKDGKTVAREYAGALLVDAGDLETTDSLTYKLNALVNMPQVVEKAYGLSDEKAEDIIEMNLSSYYINEEDYSEFKDIEISEAAYEKVLDAVMADFAEGSIGRRYLMDDSERMENCLINDLEIVLYRGKEEDTKQMQPYIYAYEETVPASASTGVITERIVVTLQITSRHTLAALEEIGVLSGPVNLMTRAQMESVDRQWEDNGRSWENIHLEEFIWNTIGE